MVCIRTGGVGVVHANARFMVMQLQVEEEVKKEVKKEVKNRIPP